MIARLTDLSGFALPRRLVALFIVGESRCPHRRLVSHDRQEPAHNRHVLEEVDHHVLHYRVHRGIRDGPEAVHNDRHWNQIEEKNSGRESGLDPEQEHQASDQLNEQRDE